MTARLRNAVLSLALICTLIAVLSVAAQDALRTPLPTPVKVKLAMLNVPALSPLCLSMRLNVRSAKQLGLTIPPSLLARADRVIE